MRLRGGPVAGSGERRTARSLVSYRIFVFWRHTVARHSGARDVCLDTLGSAGPPHASPRSLDIQPNFHGGVPTRRPTGVGVPERERRARVNQARWDDER